MKLPNAERAVIDIAKLRDYCLSPDHPRGKHKALVFQAVLGFTRRHAVDLQQALLGAARDAEAELGERDAYGQRYVVDFELDGSRGRGTVRSCWIVRTGEDYPRLTSCYVK